MKPSLEDLIQFAKEQSDHYAQMQGDRSRTNRRRKTFRYRNHMLAAIASKLEKAQAMETSLSMVIGDLGIETYWAEVELELKVIRHNQNPQD